MAVEQEESAPLNRRQQAEVIQLHPKLSEVPATARMPADWRETVAVVVLCVAAITALLLVR